MDNNAEDWSQEALNREEWKESGKAFAQQWDYHGSNLKSSNVVSKTHKT